MARKRKYGNACRSKEQSKTVFGVPCFQSSLIAFKCRPLFLLVSPFVARPFLCMHLKEKHRKKAEAREASSSMGKHGKTMERTTMQCAPKIQFVLSVFFIPSPSCPVLPDVFSLFLSCTGRQRKRTEATSSGHSFCVCVLPLASSCCPFHSFFFQEGRGREEKQREQAGSNGQHGKQTDASDNNGKKRRASRSKDLRSEI